MRDLTGLFDPDRVAVIGASDRDGSVGRVLMANLSSFDGDVLPVNPNRDSVDGRPCYPDFASVPEPASVDLAVVAVPASEVTDVVRQIGEAGVANVVVITAGFSETGDRGTERERDLIDVAAAYDLNLVGPNCVGVISTETGLNATFLRSTVESGSISLMSQSGVFISAVLSWAAREGIGFEDVVSLGNEAVLDETDFLAEWGTDPDTDVILAYLEDVEDGRAFVETARRVTRETPVVVLKSGGGRRRVPRPPPPTRGRLPGASRPIGRASTRPGASGRRPSRTCSTWARPSPDSRCPPGTTSPW